MSQRAYCTQDHPGSDQQAEDWCRRYHRPLMPLGEVCALDQPARSNG